MPLASPWDQWAYVIQQLCLVQSHLDSFIVCRDLTSSLILGLDFSSQQQIGTDWTPDGHMYLYQGKQKLIEGTVSAIAVK